MTRVARFLLPTLLATPALLLTSPDSLEAQSIGDAIIDVLEWVDEGYELLPEMGQWGLVFGWFAEGEEKEISFAVTAGQTYMIAGGGDDNSEDLDICVYDSSGAQVDCDQLTDNFPLVEFTAEATGTYRAVLDAYSVTGGTTYAGMAILRKR